MINLNDEIEAYDPDDKKHPICFTIEFNGLVEEFNIGIFLSLKEWEIYKNIENFSGDFSPGEYSRALLYAFIKSRCKNICDKTINLNDPKEPDSRYIVLEVAKRSVLDYTEFMTYEAGIFNSFPNYIEETVDLEFIEIGEVKKNLIFNMKLFKILLEFHMEVGSKSIFWEEIEDSFLQKFKKFINKSCSSNPHYADIIFSKMLKFTDWHNEWYLNEYEFI